MILTVGSLNMDLVVATNAIPRPGETVIGGSYRSFPGGKGANQANAAARAAPSGLRSALIGRVGDDAFAAALLESLQASGVDTSGVIASPGATGVAFISVASDGQNAILVAPGANALLVPDDLEVARFSQARALLLQLETRLETVLTAARLGRQAGAEVLLNLAPAQPLTPDELADIDILLVNEVEAATLLAGAARGDEFDREVALVESDPEGCLRRLRSFCPSIVLTLGGRGAAWLGPEGAGSVPAHAVSVVDTTGAGDTFAGALAVARAEGLPLAEAVAFANAAGALAVTRAGAQPSAPPRAEILALLGGPP